MAAALRHDMALPGVGALVRAAVLCVGARAMAPGARRRTGAGMSIARLERERPAAAGVDATEERHADGA